MDAMSDVSSASRLFQYLRVYVPAYCILASLTSWTLVDGG